MLLSGGATLAAIMHIVWLIVAVCGVAGVWCGALGFVFRDHLRGHFSRPRLHVTLREQREEIPLGEDVERNLGGPEHRTGTWWFHVEVSNPRRRVPIHDVRAVLCQVEDEGGRIIWDQYMDLVWSLHAGWTRAIGPPAIADLCALYENRITPRGEVQGRVLVLLPADLPPREWNIPPRLFPYNFPRLLKPKHPVVVTLMARGLEGDSDPVRIRIEWDGEWPRDHDALKKHLSVVVLT